MSAAIGQFTHASPLTDHLRSMVGMAHVYYREDRDAWYCVYSDAQGRRRHPRGGRTKAEAEVKLTLLTSKQAFVRAGLASRHQVELADHEKRPLLEHRGQYIKSLQGRAKSPVHIRNTEKWITTWMEATGADTLEAVDAVRTETWLAERVEAGWSYRTRNAHLKAARALLNWCFRHGRLSRNPLLAVEVLDETLDPRRKSKAMTPDQLADLLAACPCPRRKMYYMLAGRMGLRWGEIKRLDWSQVDLHEGWLQLKAKGTKARRGDLLPIPTDVLAALKESPAFTGPIFDSAPDARTWKRDLRRAGIIVATKISGKKTAVEYDGYRDDDGGYDRKSLRLTFGTHLYLSGARLEDAADLMRHRDVNMTRAIYQDTRLKNLRAVADGVVVRQSEPERKEQA